MSGVTQLNILPYVELPLEKYQRLSAQQIRFQISEKNTKNIVSLNGSSGNDSIDNTSSNVLILTLQFALKT